jgi:hypothetical protein
MHGFESILSHHRIRGGHYRFRIKWNTGEITSEPEKNLKEDDPTTFGEYLCSSGLSELERFSWASQYDDDLSVSGTNDHLSDDPSNDDDDLFAFCDASDDNDAYNDDGGINFSFAKVMKEHVPLPSNWPDDVVFIGDNTVDIMPKNAHELKKKYVNLQSESWTEVKVNNKVEIKPSSIENAGMGLFASTTIKKSHLIGKYRGYLCSMDEIRNRRYLCEYIPGEGQNPSGDKTEWAVDAKHVGNEMRFINHSVAGANVTAKCAGSNKRRLICINATRDIKAGEELLWNYGDCYWSVAK